MKKKIWQYKNKGLSRDKITEIARKYSLPPVIATILLNRGVKEEDMLPFFSKSMKNIINPFMMKDMDKAAGRIEQALRNKEKIVVYGDYDVDGITSTALLYEFLQSLGADVSYYIPNRRSEGYGVNIMAVNRLLKQGVKLLITVDCGITAIGETEFAKLSGMDVIITDHHTCKERLPEAAVAIVNPQRPDDDYPFRSLAGVGVAFKLMLALAIDLKLGTKTCFYRYAELAAIGTIADIVDLTGENRIIVDRGLPTITNSKRPGIKELLKLGGFEGKALSAVNVAYYLAPRLNAAGRLDSASLAVELFLTKDEEKAKELAVRLDEQNTMRRSLEQKIFNEAMEMIANDADFEKKKVIVLAHEDWHQGVIGIVASKIAESFYRPSILISCENGSGKGSARSIEGFNLYDALEACSEYLTQFGGHSLAAGLSIDTDNLEKFTDAINEYAEKVMKPDDLIPKIKIDCAVSERAITLKNAKILSALEPFGMGNERPMFSISKMKVECVRAVGNENRHLRVKVSKDSLRVWAIGFGFGDCAQELQVGDYVDLAFFMDVNKYRDSEYVQLIIKDIAFSEA